MNISTVRNLDNSKPYLEANTLKDENNNFPNLVEDSGKIKINTVGEGVNKSAGGNWLNMKTYREGIEGFVDGFADLDRAIEGSFEEKHNK